MFDMRLLGFFLILMMFFQSAYARETILIDKWGKTFNLVAPQGFCFLSNNSSTEELHKDWYAHSNRFNEDDKTKSMSIEHLEFGVLCKELQEWLAGSPISPTLRIQFAMESVQNKKLQFGLIKRLPTTQEFIDGMWNAYGDEKTLDEIIDLQNDLAERDPSIGTVSPIQKISKGKRCVYAYQSMVYVSGEETALWGSCWIKERSVTIYLYKNDGVFESADEIKNLIETLEKFSGSIH